MDANTSPNFDRQRQQGTKLQKWLPVLEFVPAPVTEAQAATEKQQKNNNNNNKAGGKKAAKGTKKRSAPAAAPAEEGCPPAKKAKDYESFTAEYSMAKEAEEKELAAECDYEIHRLLNKKTHHLKEAVKWHRAIGPLVTKEMAAAITEKDFQAMLGEDKEGEEAEADGARELAGRVVSIPLMTHSSFKLTDASDLSFYGIK
ncbi:hypothetical protein B0T18DRAFT_487266 [Schizothecium vesticola]|uniref:Uncharacterized protein n=1 Tax=Schizothecium vesticola TaxID=314040 RepID=A0AA40F173_9PEZI|nr:hypothetical protein B0T18DRAFT_487266 [Schizothecium vesticola]